jgi:hypothetical protein
LTPPRTGFPAGRGVHPTQVFCGKFPVFSGLAEGFWCKVHVFRNLEGKFLKTGNLGVLAHAAKPGETLRRVRVQYMTINYRLAD